MSDAPVLVTGATGYIGGRLVPRLLEQGYRVRCFVRSPRKLESRAWSTDPRVEVVQGDATDAASLSTAMEGVRVAYYLIHSMVAAGADYAERDRTMARTFAEAAARQGVQRIVYLGGLGELGDDLSEHLRSRREVEEALAEAGVPVTVFRAAMILGSGSASFEILRYLVERLPVMVTPRWVTTENQPIAVENVLHYLVSCIDVPETVGATLDVGGPDVVTYRDLMDVMADALGISRRVVIPLPILTPKLSALWIHLVTPLSRHIARPLAEGLRNRVVCRDMRAAELMPQRLFDVEEAIGRAVDVVNSGSVETSWSDAGIVPGDPEWAGGTSFEDVRTIRVNALPPDVYAAVTRIGGGNGWYAADILWKIRGALDQLFGGPGLRRGRRHPETLGYGDALDFWRVVDIAPNERLSLLAEMKVPGEALLEFRITETEGAAGSELEQCARFLPRGLLGLAYWYAVLPLHGIVFRGMLNGIKAEAEGRAASRP